MRRAFLGVRFAARTVEDVIGADRDEDDAAVAGAPRGPSHRHRIDRKGVLRLVLTPVDVVKGGRVDEDVRAKRIQSVAYGIRARNIEFAVRRCGNLAIVPPPRNRRAETPRAPD